MEKYFPKKSNQRSMFALLLMVLPFVSFSLTSQAGDDLPHLVKSCQEIVAPSPRLGVFEVLDKMKTGDQRSTIHPDLVRATEVDQLPKGTVVYLDSAEIKMERLHSTSFQSIKFEVTGTAPQMIRLYNPQYGEIEFKDHYFYQLLGNIYKNKHFQTRSPFLPGEFIQLGMSWNHEPATADLTLIDTTSGSTQKIPKASLPFVAKFIRAHSADAYEIEIPDKLTKEGKRYWVFKNKVNHLNVGTGKTLNAMLFPLENITPQFTLHEKVRYRDSLGLMKAAVIHQFKDGKFLIGDSDEKTWINQDEVFTTWTPGIPTSIAVGTKKYHTQNINLGVPEGLFKDVLNGAAKLSSHPDFLALSFTEQIYALMIYENTLLPWDLSGNTVEMAGLKDYSEILCAGVGVCRHNTPLMAAILSEAGLRVRIQTRVRTIEEMTTDHVQGQFNAHTWLEVDSPYINDAKTWILDPTHLVFKEMSEVIAAATSDPSSLDAIWWANRNRETLLHFSIKSPADFKLFSEISR